MAALNPAQREAVEHDLGPLLVLAGAGSGKTSVVTRRIARLVERGVPAGRILAVTFTNKAAGEMKARVASLVGAKVAKDLHVSTFHRFGLDVLSAETRALGLRGDRFTICDQGDVFGIVREALRNLKTGRSYDVSAIVTRISNAKNAFLGPEGFAEAERASRGLDEYDEVTVEVFPHYQAALRAQQAFDFDDLICEPVLLWRRRPDVLERWQTRFRYLIVDEYQDTNRAQLELVRMLATHKNVCVVGDDDQSIYAWRGADVRNILDFEDHFSGAKVVKLEQNYRSTQAILEVANSILARAPGRKYKKVLVAAQPGGEKPDLVTCADDAVEASFVASAIQKSVEQGLRRPKDFAVLYRSNLQAQAIEEALKERQIPLRQVGGQQFYERKEVKDLVAFLRVSLNPNDEMSLRRIVNYPSRGVGEAAVQRIVSHATAYDQSIWSVVSKPHAVSGLPAPAVEGCREFVRIVEQARARFAAGKPSAEVARGILEDAGFKADIQAASNSNSAAARRWGNLEALLNVFAKRDERGVGTPEKLGEFLRVLALREESGEEDATDRVTLTTIHGSKGLEWKVVFLIGLEEGLLPHARSIDARASDAPVATGDPDAGTTIDEERRLFYVAVTRAREKLYMSRAKARMIRGKQAPRTPCRFLSDIPEELVTLREEDAPVAPELGRTAAGAAAVLAAIFEPAMGGASGELPLIPRRRR